MVVRRSPFSKTPTPPKPDPSGTVEQKQAFYSGIYSGDITRLPKPKKNAPPSASLEDIFAKYANKYSGAKTTANIERGELSDAERSAIARVAQAKNLSPEQREEAFKSIEAIAQRGQPARKSGGLIGFLKDAAVRVVGGPIVGMGEAYNTVIAPIGRAIQSTAVELSDAVVDPFSKDKKYRFSVSDWWRQYNDENWGIYKGNSQYKTGYKWLDGGLQLGTDIATDPTTYVGVGPTAYVGKAGRAALTARLGTKETLERFPQLAEAGVLDDILRYGESAVPKDVRAALGIETGLRFAGKVVPATEGVSTAWRATGGEVRARVGDAMFKYLPDVAFGLTPKSQRLMAANYLGRGLAAGSEKVVPTIANWTATKYAKGAVATAYSRAANEAKKIVEEQNTLKAALDKDADNIYRLVENPAAYAQASDTAKAVADNYRDWQNALRDQVNSTYRKIASDYGVDVADVGFVEDYIHHRITKDAKDFWASGRMASKGWFKAADMSAIDLTETGAPLMYRKLRAGEEFMGETLQSGSIDEINAISRKNAGFDWFETDLSTIADGYAYSMSKALGRGAYVRRMYDFGSDAIKPILPQIIPDKDLVTRMTKAHDLLVSTQKRLRDRVSVSVASIKDEGDRAVRLAERTLSGGRKRAAQADAEAVRTIAAIDKMVNDLEKAREIASTKTVDARGDFGVVHQELIEQLTSLRAAIAAGDSERYAVTQELRRVYAKMYPNHNPKTLEGKPAEWLAEKILTGRGTPAAREVRAINDRIATIRGELDELGTSAENADAIQSRLDELADLEESSFAFGVLADVRARATYAPDGLMYGGMDDLVELPPEVVNFKIFNTVPLDESVRNSPDTIVTRAIPEDDLLDMRLPDDFNMVFGADYIGESIARSLDLAQMPELGEAFSAAYRSYLATQKFDPLFLDTYPEMAELIQTLTRLKRAKFDEVVGEDAIIGAFTDIEEGLMRMLATRGYEGSDEMAKQMMDDVYGNLIYSTERDGLLLPMNLVHASDEFPSQYSVLTQPVWTPPKLAEGVTAPTQVVQGNQFVNRILDGFYEQDSLDVANRMADASEQLIQLEAKSVGIDDLNAELKSLGKQKGGYKSAAAKRIKAAEQAKEKLAAGQSIEIRIGGKTVRMSREKAQEQLVKLDRKMQLAEAKFQREVDKIYRDLKIPKTEAQLATAQERLPMLMNQAYVLNRWNDTVGAVLQADVDTLSTLIKNAPARGAAGGQSAAWLRKVERSVKALEQFQDPSARTAYERVTRLLHADEARLAALDEEVTESGINLMMAKKGEFGKLIKAAEEGWEEIAGLGVQVPEELIASWKPNLAKLKSEAEAGKLRRAYMWYNRFFKTYATLTGGFLVRNGISATFMNYVAGVPTDEIIEGAKIGFRIQRNPLNWLDDVPAADRALYEEAWRATEATGRGLADELAMPSVRASKAEKIINNRVTKKFARANETVERMVRLPMALDTLRKGGSYDEAVARVSRYHFDYSDLSGFDEKAKQIVPFWIWTSRNVPLQAVTQWSRPSVYATYEKIRESSPVNDDLMMPKWIADYSPIGLTAGSVLAPDLPMSRLNQQLEQFYRPSKIAGQFNPLVKLPLEVLAGRQLGIDVGPFKETKQDARGKDALVGQLLSILTGENLASVDEAGNVTVDEKVPYIINSLIPSLGTLDRLTGGATGGKATLDERQLSNILNTVFGIPVRTIGEQQQRGEAIRRQFEIKDLVSEMVKQGLIPRQK